MKIVEGDKATAFPLLAKVIERGGHNWDEICRKIDEKHCQLWLVVTDRPIAALVTQCTVDDELEILIAGGESAASWVAIAERDIGGFARANGLKLMRIWGRKGWMRLLPHWTVMGVEDDLVIIEVLL